MKTEIWSKTAVVFLIALTLSAIGCGNNKEDSDSNSGKSYDFSSTANASITNSFASLLGEEFKFKPEAGPLSANGPTLCSSVVCFTPTEVSGKYYGTGLSIQSNGNGMMAYFGQDSWANIVGTSTSYDFSSTTPVVNAGNLVCCAGTGDLSSSSTYIESVAYLFSYLDVTFEVTGVTGNTSMNATYKLRFVFADDAITDGKRGDVLVFDSGAFKWMNNADSALSTTRPAVPVTMNTSIVNYTNPFGPSAGNQHIPVIYASVVTPASGRMTITETELRAVGKTYGFGFNMTNFVMFPTLISPTDLNMISSLKELMSRVHLGGLPHSQQTRGVGGPADTELTISN